MVFYQCSKLMQNFLWTSSTHCLPSRIPGRPDLFVRFKPFVWLLWETYHILSAIILVSSSSMSPFSRSFGFFQKTSRPSRAASSALRASSLQKPPSPRGSSPRPRRSSKSSPFRSFLMFFCFCRERHQFFFTLLGLFEAFVPGLCLSSRNHGAWPQDLFSLVLRS